MRRILISTLALLVSLAAVGTANVAVGANTQTLDARFAPVRVPKFNRAPGSINVVTTTGPAAGASGPGAVAPAVRAKIFFDRHLAFFTRGLAVCRSGRIEGKTDTEARAICRRARVGAGTAKVALAGDPSQILTAKVTAFNGPTRGRKPTIVLHTWQQDTGLASILTGILRRSGGTYGYILDVSIPQLPFGTAITRFQTRVQKTFRFRGKSRSYVSARCARNSRRWFFKGVFNYNGSPRRIGKDVQSCRVRG